MFLRRVLTSKKSDTQYLQGGLHVLTLKSFRLTSQYIPHYSGLVGTNMNFLQLHSLHEVLNFLPK